jgi:hypothetical protein
VIVSHDQAIDEMCTMLKNAWEGNSDTLNIPITWADVSGDRQGSPDPFQNPAPFLLVYTLHEGGSQQSLRSQGRQARYEYTGTLMANLHVQEGKGSIHALPLISVASSAFASQASPNGVWFRNTKITSIGPQGVWYVMAMTTDFLYDLFA